MTAKVIGNDDDDNDDDDGDGDVDGNDDNDDEELMMIVDIDNVIVKMIVSTPGGLNFLCLVSFDGIPTLYNCNTKVSSGSQMVTAKEGRGGGELFLMR